MATFRQESFAGGYVSPALHGHVSQLKYQTGLAEALNFQITRFATAENRAGTQYIGTEGSADYVRIVPFVFNADISYLLEFGDLYIRVWRNGGRIDVSGAAAYAGGTEYDIGDLVTDSGIVYYSITAANVGNTPASSATDWFPQVDNLLEIPTNLEQDALSSFQYVQQNDILTVAHQSIIPQQLQRHSDTHWAWVEFASSTGIDAPTNVDVVAGVGPSPAPGAPSSGHRVSGGLADIGHTTHYAVSAFDFNSYSAADTFDVVNLIPTVGQPMVIAWTAGSGNDGWLVYRDGRLIAVVDSPGATYTDDGEITTCPLLLPAGPTGTIIYTYVVTAISSATGSESLASASASVTAGTPTDANPNVITWDAVDGASGYNIYRVVAGIPGFVGTAPVGIETFSDNNITPETAIQPPVPVTLFSTPNDYPGAVGFYQQRLCFGNTLNQPQTVSASQVGNYYNFTTSSPVVDSDSVQFTIAGRQVQEVRAMIDLGKLILHTSGDEYVATGNQAGTLTPTGIGLVHQSSAGCANLVPLVIGNIGIFVQSRGSFLRDLEYSIYTTSFKGRDLTKFAPDLFTNRTIVDFAWQQIPNSIVWCVMSDGTLLGLTYSKDDDIWAWHRHELAGGNVEAVCVVPEGEQDVLYVSVLRTIDGSPVRYIERLNPREFTDITIDAVFTDSSLSYDGTNESGTTMLATTGAGWTPQDDLTLTASAPFFVAGDVGNAIVLQQVDEDGVITSRITLDIIAYVSTTVVTVQPDQDVPSWAQVALTTWGHAVHEFAGLDHLEGETIKGLGDGNVLSDMVVESGEVATESNFVVVHLGLGITADLQTLPIENTQGETISNKKVTVQEVTPIFYNSRGGSYGQDFDHLKTFPARVTEPWNTPVYLINGPQRISIDGMWQRTGQVCIRQTDPLPIGLSAIVASGQIGN